MKFFSQREEDNIHLQIAWNAATVGLNPTRIRKGLLKRNTIMFYDISKSCKLIDMSEQEYMSLKTQAQLLCGISKIMRQKTSFLYEDTLHLCDKLRSALVISPARTDHIDLQKPIINLRGITLKDTEDLLEYQNSTQDAPFSDLFDFTSCIGGPSFYDNKLYNEDLDSMLRLTNSLSIDLPYVESQNPEMFIPNYQDNNDNSDFMQTNNLKDNSTLLFDDLDCGIDMDIDTSDGYNEGVDFSEAILGLGAQNNISNNAELSISGHMDDNNNIFEFPNLFPIEEQQQQLGARRSSSPRTPTSSTTTTSSRSHNNSGHHTRVSSNGGGDLPPLIAEEEEYFNEESFSSIGTEMYSNIIQVSPIPPEPHRPRIVQRMMLRREQDTILPWSFYTDTEPILRKSITGQQNKNQLKKEKLNKIQKELNYPSIAFNDLCLARQEELAFSIREDEKYRFYFPHNYLKETNIEYTRNNRQQGIEVSRRADHHRRFSSSNGSTSGTSANNVHVRSSSEVTNSLEMHNIDLGDVDMQDGEIRRNVIEEPNFEGKSNYTDDQFNYDDHDIIDYNYLHFENENGFTLDNNDYYTTGLNSSLPREQDDERQRNEFLIELSTIGGDNRNKKFGLNELFQSKSRYDKAKAFYFLLELASKTKVRLYQKEAFGTIEVQLI